LVIGKVINADLNRQDGRNSKWTKTVDVRELGNLPNRPGAADQDGGVDAAVSHARVQTDDGNQDVADLHAREDLLLDY